MTWRGSLLCIGCLAISGLCLMAAMLWLAFMHGDLKAEGEVIMQMTWGRATLADVYVGLVLFCAWVFRREERLLVAVPWSAAILVGGNLVTCCYLLRALGTSGSAAGFWMGVRHET